MSELLPIWNEDQLSGATPPAPFSIPNNPNARSLKINNQSRYWLFIMKTQTNINVDRIEPFSHLIIPFEPDLSLVVDDSAIKSSLSPDNQFVDYSTIDGVLGYQKGSTQFSGSSTVDINNAQVNMTATSVTVNNGGTGSLLNASGTITTSNVSQTVLPQDTTGKRRYLLFQNLSATDMYINSGAAATTGAGSMLVQKNGGAITFEASFIPTDAINVICATAGAAFTCKYA